MNNYLIIGDNLKILIDTGFIATNKEISRFFYKNKIEFKDIDLIFNTHCHLDHSGKNKFFKSIANAEILIHEEDKPAVETLEGLKAQVGSFAYTHEEFWKQRLKWWNYEGGSKVDNTINDNDIFDLGNHKMRVIHTPGHTLGHCVFLLDGKILFAGDMGFETLWYGNARASLLKYISSYKKLLNLNLDMVLSGHLDPVKENIKERYLRKLKQIEERDIKILNLIKKGYNSLELLVNQHPTLRNRSNILADKLWQDYGEKNQILQHIEKLKNENTIQELIDNKKKKIWKLI